MLLGWESIPYERRDAFRPWLRQEMAVNSAAGRLGATPADVPGLWNLPGYPELTTGQLLEVASRAP